MPATRMPVSYTHLRFDNFDHGFISTAQEAYKVSQVRRLNMFRGKFYERFSDTMTNVLH